MRMRVRVRVSVHPLAAAGMFLLFFATPRGAAFAVLSSVVLHELGHGAAALLLGREIRSVRLLPSGISLGLSPPASYREELFIAAAGPFMNLCYGALAVLLPPELREAVTALSLFLAVLNLLPIRSLDGGRILYALLAPRLGEGAAEGVLRFFDGVCLLMLFILALYLFFYTAANLALLFFCACLFFGRSLKNR